MEDKLDLEHMDDMEAAHEWFLRLKVDPDNPELLLAFSRWKDASPERESCYLNVLLLWDDLDRAADLAAADREQFSETLRAEPGDVEIPAPELNNGANRLWFIGLAVSVLCLCLVFIPGTFNSIDADYHTTTAERVSITLDDGSVVQLNARSALNVEFGEQIRYLELLEGEAYFNVAHNKERPFVVRAGGTEVKALGTAFNIQLDEQRVQTRLVEGSVEVAAANDVLQLTPGQQVLSLPGQSLQPSKHSYRPGSKPAWTQNLLRLDQQPLLKVVEQLNRQYPALIRVGDSELDSMLVSGTLPLDDLDTVLSMLQETLSIEHTKFGVSEGYQVVVLY